VVSKLLHLTTTEGRDSTTRKTQLTVAYMPCYDAEARERPQRLESKVHKLTAMLCGLCTKIENSSLRSMIDSDPNLSDWWQNHKTHDERIAAIKQKRDALGSHCLTDKEFELLWNADDISY
jgi:hypothetical protein